MISCTSSKAAVVNHIAGLVPVGSRDWFADIVSETELRQSYMVETALESEFDSVGNRKNQSMRRNPVSVDYTPSYVPGSVNPFLQPG